MRNIARKLPIATLFFGASFQLASCTWRVAHFWVSEKDKHYIYTFKVPSHCTCTFSADENSNRKVYKFNDSSYIAIDDNIAPFAFPKQVYQKYGRDANIKFLGVDTLTIFGQDSLGRYWKVVKNKYAIYSYWNVSKYDKQNFDRVLASVQLTIDDRYSNKKNELAKK